MIKPIYAKEARECTNENKGKRRPTVLKQTAFEKIMAKIIDASSYGEEAVFTYHTDYSGYDEDEVLRTLKEYGYTIYEEPYWIAITW